MAITQHASGTQATSGTTEHFQGTDPDTTDGVFQFMIDVSDMVRTDELNIRIYEKTTGTGDTARLIHTWKLKHQQTDTLWVSPTLILIHGWRFSLQADVGAISLPWSIRKVA